ncbi:protein FAR1-RELATED SEQUENCE 5-like [Vicia villosa]|uniref:protein FAR1-RELATED SEQUENCE 5-like n=1 Tax=Vicia villosa TaxID=3911 RepID=UPI00273BD73D|nr:protein FAR1-RELATED SEQUENCE 5-like [Vicia villosa]
MYHKHPKGVVTDGDLAMREAIRDVFPNSLHRLFSWHLHRNACENVKNPKFLEEFKSLIYATYTVDEFENEWKRVVDDCGLSNNKWVKKTYEMKRIWASAYMRDKFFCGIRTTSISEAVNSFIKMYVQNKSSLVDFLHGFERAVKEYRHNELMSNFKTFYYDLVLTTKLEGLELEAAKIFTGKKFKEVQDEIEDAITVNVIERSELKNVVTFKMNRFCNKNSTYLVHLDRAQSKFLCDCNLFERVGIPCSHIICAMRHEHINIFPNSLICKRWTRSAKDDYISSMSFEECDDEKMVMFRRGTMSSAFNSLCDISCKHPDDFKEALKGIYSLCEKIKRRRDVNGNHKTNTNVINDPIQAKTKGAPRKNKGIPRKTKGASRKTKGVPCNTSHTKHKCQDIGKNDVLHEVDKGSVAISNVGCEDVDKNYDSQQKKKDVDVVCSMKEFINKRTSKHIENEVIGRSNENVPNTPTAFENVSSFSFS